jgi:hypothetical protein
MLSIQSEYYGKIISIIILTGVNPLMNGSGDMKPSSIKHKFGYVMVLRLDLRVVVLTDVKNNGTRGTREFR